MVKPEQLDVMEHEILYAEVDSTQLRGRVKTRIEVKDLLRQEIRHRELVLYYYREKKEGPWYMRLESSLRSLDADRDKNTTTRSCQLASRDGAGYRQPMFQPQSELVRILQERGFIYQATELEALDAKAAAGRLVAYVGYDCTASLATRRKPGFHHDAALATEDRALPAGAARRRHHAVRQPSGKDESRKLLDDAAIDANLRSLSKSSRVLSSLERAARHAW